MRQPWQLEAEMQRERVWATKMGWRNRPLPLNTCSNILWSSASAAAPERDCILTASSFDSQTSVCKLNQWTGSGRAWCFHPQIQTHLRPAWIRGTFSSPHKRKQCIRTSKTWIHIPRTQIHAWTAVFHAATEGMSLNCSISWAAGRLNHPQLWRTIHCALKCWHKDLLLMV